MQKRYRNPANGYVEEVGVGANYGVFFLGGIYLAMKGLWGHVAIWFAAIIIPTALSGGPLFVVFLPVTTLIYTIAIQDILGARYMRKGWIPVEAGHISAVGGLASPVTVRKCPYCAEEIKLEAIRCKHCHADLAPALVGAHLETVASAASSGLAANSATEVVDNEGPRQPKNGAGDVMIIVGLIVIGLALYFVLNHETSDGPERREAAEIRACKEAARYKPDLTFGCNLREGEFLTKYGRAP